MFRKYHKVPFFIELILNGLFIFLYSLYTGDGPSNGVFLNKDAVRIVVTALGYTAPFIVAIVLMANYSKCHDMEDFFRKYIFSIIIFIPLIITFGDLDFTFKLCLVHLFSSTLSLYDNDVVKERKTLLTAELSRSNLFEKIKLVPAQWVIITFGGLILMGTFVLLLPFSSSTPNSISFIDALFTATSATCVTGLSTLSLADNFSPVGQMIVLILIQIGGLGFMTLSSSLTIIMGRSLGLKNQVVMQDLLDISSFEDLVSLIVDIIKYTVAIETWGGIILSIGFTIEGHEFGQAIYYGFFHSISAFCNAGFALFNNSLVDFGTNPLIQITICVLIVLGGLGFIVIKELESVFIKRTRQLVNMTVHTKIVLFTSFALIAGLGIYIFFSEYLNALDSYSLLDKIQISLFQSITARTAGFNTISLNSLQPHTLYMICLIMFIGASPGSTGGGIKTTTFAILFQSVKATMRGRDRVEFFARTIPNNIVVRAIAIIVVSLITVSFFILLIMRIETEQSFMTLFFEVVSAFATVGLSLGITPYLSVAGKLALVVLMFIGRVGPLTMALAIGQKRQSEGRLKYPEGRVMIG